MIFGLIGVTVFRGFEGKVNLLFAIMFAFLSTISTSVLWRKYIQRRFSEFLRKRRISWDDGVKNPWQSMQQDTRFNVTQLTVRLKSGRVLHCESVGNFNIAPHGPCMFGEDGSVGIYVTQITYADGSEHPWNPHDENGFQMTFVPASEIQEVDIRFIHPT